MTPIGFLVWFGLVRRRRNGSIVWPFHVGPAWIWKAHLRAHFDRLVWGDAPPGGFPDRVFGLFRNRLGVKAYLRGRLLPWRWGFYVLDFEVGDRGGENVPGPDDRFSRETRAWLVPLVRGAVGKGWELPRAARALVIDHLTPHHPEAWKVADALDQVAWFAVHAGNGLVDAIADVDPADRERARDIAYQEAVYAEAVAVEMASQGAAA